MQRKFAEETGTDKYKIITELPGKILLNFNEDIRKRIGYERQETTMFLIEFVGDQSDLMPTDKEIDEIMLVDSEDLLNKPSHEETVDYVQRYCPFLLS